MIKVNPNNFSGKIQIWLDYTISNKFYEIYMDNSNYSSFISFCKGLMESLKTKEKRALLYIGNVLPSFKLISGFNDDLAVGYIVNFLQNERYIRYAEVSRLEYEINHKKKKN